MSEGVPVCSKTPEGAGTHGGQTHGSVRTNNLRTATTPCGSLFVVRITVHCYALRVTAAVSTGDSVWAPGVGGDRARA
jgi:hypothetical protein